MHHGGLHPASGPQDTLFDTLTQMTGDGLCLAEIITDDAGRAVDYRFLETNPLFEDHTGLRGAAGRTARELVPELESRWVETYARVGLGRETLRFEDGSSPMGRWFEVYASPAPATGQLFILFRDVTTRKELEVTHAQALDQATRLLGELNHRVKNSLAIIASVISLEKRSAETGAQPVLERLASRVGAVKALYLALADTGTFDTVSTGPYLEQIVAGLQGAVARDEQIEIRAEIDDFDISADCAVPLGLVVNELVTNAVKHAFAPDAGGRVVVSLRRGPEGTTLCVADSGGGTEASPERAPQAPETGTGLGARLIQAFAQDLGATVETDFAATGTRVTLRF